MYAIPQELVTLVSHRGTDKYFLLQYPFTAAKYLFSCIYLRYVCWTYWWLCGNEPLEVEIESQININCFEDVWTLSSPCMSNTPLLKFCKKKRCHSSITLHHFLFSAPSKWNVFYYITEIGAHKLRFHAPFTMDTTRERIMLDVYFQCIDILHPVFCIYVNLW